METDQLRNVEYKCGFAVCVCASGLYECYFFSFNEDEIESAAALVENYFNVTWSVQIRSTERSNAIRFQSQKCTL